jgi:methylated-DNA-[protein]-cysteine S-methyltransferase
LNSTLKLFYHSLDSRLGKFTIVWQEEDEIPKIQRIFLSNLGCTSEDKARVIFQELVSEIHPAISETGRKIQTFLAGDAVNFDLEFLNMEQCTTFQRMVLLAESEVPRGWVTTYARIARNLGIHDGARAVGNALAQNPFPIIIPCHRAIRSDSRLGGFQGGVALKRALLMLEGVEVDAGGRVHNPRIFY